MLTVVNICRWRVPSRLFVNERRTFWDGTAVAQSRLGRRGPRQTETINEAHIPIWDVDDAIDRARR